MKYSSNSSRPIHIAVSGTPGAGKTTLSKRIAKILGIKYISLIDVILANKLYQKYDRRDKTYDVSMGKVEKYLQKNLNFRESYVIDSHLGQLLSKKIVEGVIITTCELSVLNKRLLRRKYSAQKIRDNLDAEIFSVCYTQSVDNKKKTIKIDCTKKLKEKEIKDITNHLRRHLLLQRPL